jgi:hypothetical protein
VVLGVTGTEVTFTYPPPPPPAPAFGAKTVTEPPPAPPPPQDSTVNEVTPAGHVQVPDAVKDCVVVWPKRFVLETKKENRNKQIKNAMGLFELYAFGKPDFASIVILGFMELG